MTDDASKKENESAFVNKTKAEWRELLPSDSYRVLFEEATEPAGSSVLDGEKRPGTYVCAACSLPLFTSDAKFDSGTGWPSFFDPLPERVETKRRTAADGQALLQQRGRTAVRAGWGASPGPSGVRRHASE